MWLCLNNSFLSIVQPDTGEGDVLLVRARRKGDIERVFPAAKVKCTPGRDYLYRAEIERSAVQAAVSEQVAAINYSNFKDSVSNVNLHRAYGRVWSLMAGLQRLAPYSRV